MKELASENRQTPIQTDATGCKMARMPQRMTVFGFSLYPRAAASQNNSTRIYLNEEKTL
jgi:hypothetical protein